MFQFEKLAVWKKAIAFADQVSSMSRFIEIAYGSRMQVVPLAQVARQQSFLHDDQPNSLRTAAGELARMMSGLKSSLDN